MKYIKEKLIAKKSIYPAGVAACLHIRRTNDDVFTDYITDGKVDNDVKAALKNRGFKFSLELLNKFAKTYSKEELEKYEGISMNKISNSWLKKVPVIYDVKGNEIEIATEWISCFYDVKAHNASCKIDPKTGKKTCNLQAAVYITNVDKVWSTDEKKATFANTASFTKFYESIIEMEKYSLFNFVISYMHAVDFDQTHLPENQALSIKYFKRMTNKKMMKYGIGEFNLFGDDD